MVGKARLEVVVLFGSEVLRRRDVKSKLFG